MHKLTNVEAQRVMTVLGETLDRLGYLSNVPLAPHEELREQLQDQSLDGVVSALEAQWVAEDEALNPQEDDEAEEGGTVNDALAAQAERVKALRGSTRALARSLRANPAAVQMMHAGLAQERTPGFLALLTAVKELSEVTYLKLRTTVEDEKAHHDLREEKRASQEKLEEQRSQKNADLQQLRKTKEEELAVLIESKAKLRTELEELNQSNAVELRLIAQEQEERATKEDERHTAAMEALTKEEEALRKALHEQKEAEESSKVLKDMNRARTELIGVIEQYDEKVTAQQAAAEEIVAAQAAEAVQLAKLQEHFDVVDAENKRIAEEDEILAGIRAREDAALKVLNDCATMVQKRQRGIMIRAQKLLAGKKKKGKKGKKGKKKK